VGGLRLLTRDEVSRREPEITCAAAVLSPSTRIVDSHGFMLALQVYAEAAWAMLAFDAPMLGGKIDADDITL
jgi:L-2-hydroxyglutarate oxidase LhgO